MLNFIFPVFTFVEKSDPLVGFSVFFFLVSHTALSHKETRLTDLGKHLVYSQPK